MVPAARGYHRGMGPQADTGMPPTGTPATPLTAQERRVLLRARAAFARASMLVVLAAVSAGAALVGAASGRLDAGVAVCWVLLCAGWIGLLRHAPRRWRAAGRDLVRGHAERLRGIAGIRQRRGIGLIAPSHHQLLLAGRRFALSAAQAEVLREGMPVEARVAPEAGVLLSVAMRPETTPPGSPPAARPSGHGSPPPTPAAAARPAVAPDGGLTGRETELLALIAAGFSDKEIARRLALEPATVRTYNSQLYAKLGVRRRTEAVARGRALGLLDDARD